ncbi:MAG TPA: DUF4190 domain-containing protein [Solirubrobacteraceae bacterium]|nr:DUF4190 domain-containing protein [Solirubrobacteraceae bacterium]
MSSHAASLSRPVATPAEAAAAPGEPLPSLSPLDVHIAPTQDSRRRSGRAGGALVLGILALCCSVIPILGLILGIVAVTKGVSTAADVRRTGQGGAGRARIGEVPGVVAIVLSIAFPIAFGFLL